MNAHFFNRRLFFRRAINEPAWFERSSNNILERCILVNLCEIGARLTISDVYDLPEKFALHLTRGSNLVRRCRVIWQQDHEVGVEFLSEVPLDHTTVPEKSICLYPFPMWSKYSRNTPPGIPEWMRKK